MEIQENKLEEKVKLVKKRPFLKKGTGLNRYYKNGITPTPPRPKVTFSKNKNVKISFSSDTNDEENQKSSSDIEFINDLTISDKLINNHNEDNNIKRLKSGKELEDDKEKELKELMLFEIMEEASEDEKNNLSIIEKFLKETSFLRSLKLNGNAEEESDNDNDETSEFETCSESESSSNSSSSSSFEDEDHEEEYVSEIEDKYIKKDKSRSPRVKRGNINCAFSSSDNSSSSLNSFKANQKNNSIKEKNKEEEVVEVCLDEERILPNGDTEIKYKNGSRKTISADGKITKWFYFNGDVKEICNDGSTKYFYAENSIWQSKFSDGTEILQFTNGQVERKLTDGKIEILFPNGLTQMIYPSGRQDIIFPDKTTVQKETNGEKTVVMSNGQKEIQRKEYIMRIFNDGTKKILYKDGSQETRYSNGRIRIKDKMGNSFNIKR